MAFLGHYADAEDVTQETFCRLLYRAPSFKEEPSEALASPGCSQSMPEQYKLPIHLYYYEGYSVAEFAEIIKRGKSAVEMRLKRGRGLLK